MTTQMLSEIREQPEALRRTLAALLPLRPQIARCAEGRRHVLFAARGSSDNAALYGRYLVETHAALQAAMLAPSVFTHYGTTMDLTDTLVITVSQSGATQELVDTQQAARRLGAATIAVTNVESSALAAGADLALVTQAGAELAVPATKTYLCQVLAMAVLASALDPADDSALDAALASVPDLVEAALDGSPAIDEAVELLAGATGPTLVTGRGMLLGSALEAALKIEETCLRPVRGYSYADLRHGPIAVVRPGAVALLLAPPAGPMAEPLVELATTLTERGAAVIGLGGDDDFAQRCAVHIEAPELPEPLAPLGHAVPAQLVVERLAARLGLDADNPRGLAKVTQTDADSSHTSP